ncbi:MAG: undecaprenyl-diphosphate phosphatase [Muribaculaceae bacterium]|nr:undecaprenyl-diphosphate phosphatase [Muribaculaceae bacterium]MDE6009179.1 undecaprenyl-diphosphate phosphatase [Muribaculaceae bacterium]
MEWLDALILGIVQGLAEYLPISSSGHLEIFREILGIDLPSDKILQFDLIVHAATVCSTIVVLWPMFKKLCVSFFGFKMDSDFFYVCKILLSCIPIGIVGVFFKDTVEEFFGNGLTIVGICLIVTALLLSFAHYTGRREDAKGMVSANSGRDITWMDAFVIGCAQAVAVLPGLSRSGTTIATGILIGDKRDKVASFSFLMVIIPILGEALLDLKDILTEPAAQGDNAVGALSLIIGFLASFIVGCCACKWMLNLVKKGKLIWFALYCVAMGILCLLWH